MNTIALRYAENFAPSIGTIMAHQEVIDKNGYVWWGKLGSPISKKVEENVMKNEHPQILLIHSGKTDRYWAHISEIKRELDNLESVPSYYRDRADKIKCWFKVEKFEKADKDVLAKCFVTSSKKSLSEASRYSMSPYFIIEYNKEG